ncbi:heme ABC transporter permease [Oleiagrimonas sp. C23AA]|uniref:heme ABC transporter permease n=1 Tax=Oleiagrimonas sp. C23AA TaxID=2719047 RepID=UPI00142253DF|nr:heme ABC transporter permease [Oleiagrimonas sp. C23AA]NII09448.1 heme ABC transporter permease [Oleiagrimonas sp. C23AA]
MNKLVYWYHKLGSPPTFYRFAGVLRPWCLAIALILAVIGLYGGLYLAPADYQQGDAYRIIFIHVPSAWMSLFIYGVMAVAALVAVVWRMKMAEVIAMQSAPIGAAFTFITLCTGSLWGKPMWGTWWTWDARLTSELVLLFIYLGIIGLFHAFEDRRHGARAACFLILVGVVNLPIVHYSVVWWNTLHQGTTVRIFGKSNITTSMLWPLLVMMFSTKFYYAASLFGRARADLLDLESGKAWVKQIASDEEARS